MIFSLYFLILFWNLFFYNEHNYLKNKKQISKLKKWSGYNFKIKKNVQLCNGILLLINMVP